MKGVANHQIQSKNMVPQSGDAKKSKCINVLQGILPFGINTHEDTRSVFDQGKMFT